MHSWVSPREFSGRQKKAIGKQTEAACAAMSTIPKQRELTFLKKISGERMPGAELRLAEDALARLVALAYAAEHPELFTAPGSTSVRRDDLLPRCNLR